MGLEQLWRCDVCGATTPQGEATGWRKVSIAALEETPPTQVEGMPLDPTAAAPRPPGPSSLCPKASCLATWAKKQNAAAKT